MKIPKETSEGSGDSLALKQESRELIKINRRLLFTMRY